MRDSVKHMEFMGSILILNYWNWSKHKTKTKTKQKGSLLSRSPISSQSILPYYYAKPMQTQYTSKIWIILNIQTIPNSKGQIQYKPNITFSNFKLSRYYTSFRSTEQNLIEEGTCTFKFIPILRWVRRWLHQKIVIRQFLWYWGRLFDMRRRRGNLNKHRLLRWWQVFVVLAGAIEEKETRVDRRAMTCRRGGVVGRTVRRWVLFPEEVRSVSHDLTDGNITKGIWDNKFRILVLWNQHNQRGGRASISSLTAPFVERGWATYCWVRSDSCFSQNLSVWSEGSKLLPTRSLVETSTIPPTQLSGDAGVVVFQL